MVHSKKISQEELKDILKNKFKLKLISSTDVRAALKVVTNKGTFGFVKASSRKKLAGLVSFLNYLGDRKFEQISKIFPTTKGDYYVKFGEQRVKLIQWLDGRECNLNDPHILGKTAEAYARFHLASQGFIPPLKSKWKSNLGLWPANFTKSFIFLKELKTKTVNKSNHDEFEKLLLKTIDQFYKDMELTLRLLEVSDYKSQVKKALKKPCTIHHSCYYQNLIYGKDGDVYIIDYGKLMMDLPIHDIANLMIRHVRHHKWNFQDAKVILDNYQLYRKLTSQDMELLYILILYPKRYLKIIQKYMKGNKELSYLVKHLDGIIKEIPLKTKFLKEFRQTYLS
jgi:CotS family spore coat protein